MTFPGEDRAFLGDELFIDMLPSSSWYKNARSAMSKSAWAKIRETVIERAGNACEVAACKSNDRLEAHERWDYDDLTKLQTLRRLVCLCHACHESTHFGNAVRRQTGKAAAAHLITINDWSFEEFEEHLAATTALWKARNKIAWTIDLSILGIDAIEPT